MKRSEFRNILLGLVGLSVLTGCKSRVGKSASDTSMGDPYKCSKCGYLTRSKADLTGKRCPRCYAKAMQKISENEMAAALKSETEK